MLKRLLVIVTLLCPVPALADQADLEALMRHAEFQEMAISPSGKYLAATVPEGDQVGAVILDIEAFPEVKLMGNFRMGGNENATGLVWANDERLVFTSTVQEGALAQPRITGRFYAIDADGSNGRQLYGHREGSMVFRWGEIIHRLPDDDRHVLIMDWAHDRESPAAWRLDIYREDRVRSVAVSPLRRGGLAADQDGEVRFAYGMDTEWNQMLAWRADSESDWTTFENPFDGDIEFWGFDEEGTHVFIASRDESNLGVYKIHLASGKHERLLSDDTFAPVRPIWDAAGEMLIGAVFATPVPKTRFIDPQHPTARIWRSLQAELPQFNARIFNFTEDGSQAITLLNSDREPGVFVLLDVESMALHELAAAREWLAPENMAEMKPIEFSARDGLKLHGYLTLPPGSEGRNLPMIVEVHGGPHGPYDAWGFNQYIQAWAQNGYAVLQINYRGSGGRSHQFERDAFGQWGAEMQDDLTDGTLWAINEGIADADRICISGASYGGYAVLSGVVRDPELYRCGFAFVGVYDLKLMKKKGDIPQSDMGRRYLDDALGTDRQVLRERSPINHVSNIRADLFVAHGSEDIRAHFSQYHALTEKLDEADIAYEKLFVRGEGHGFYELENRVLLYGKALEFFDRNIGSGYQSRDEEVVRRALDRAAGDTGEQTAP